MLEINRLWNRAGIPKIQIWLENETKICIPTPHPRAAYFLHSQCSGWRAHSLTLARTFARLYFIMQMTPLIPGSLFALIFVRAREHIYSVSAHSFPHLLANFQQQQQHPFSALVCTGCCVRQPSPRADTLSRRADNAPRALAD